MKTDCIIIEDEPLAIERLSGYIEQCSFLNLLASFNNPIDGLSFLKENKVDLLFLDISMKQLSGIKLLENIKFSGKVIITTAYDKYALKGFELNVSDYLLKPYSFERFLKAVDKVREQLLNEPINQQPFIFIKTENRLEKINFEEILYIEGMGDYRRIHCTKKKIMTLQTFSELEHLIPDSIVIRVHKSFMVSINKIESIERNRIKINDIRIPISESYKAIFYDKISKP